MITYDYTGRVVMITGIGRGMGRCAAEMFAAAGAQVVGADMDPIGGRETAERIQSNGGLCDFVPADLSDEAQVQKWVNHAVTKFGRIDVLYNNASAPIVALTTEMPLENWNRILRNEITLVFLAVKHAVPHMPPGSVIINIGSTAGVPGVGTGMPGGAPGGAPHAATKAAVIGMTRAWAVEFGPLGIRVVALSPGLIETEGTRDLFEDPVLFEACKRLSVDGRWGQPENVVRTAMFLASDDASYITGSNILVDGGWAAMGTGAPTVTWDELMGKAGYQ